MITKTTNCYHFMTDDVRMHVWIENEKANSPKIKYIEVVVKMLLIAESVWQRKIWHSDTLSLIRMHVLDR